MTDFEDLPWDELLARANETIAGGATVYQKFTCAQCGARQTIEDANTFYQEGECEECRHITDLLKHGGGYLAHFTVAPD